MEIEIRDRILTISGARIHYFDEGEKGAPSLVFLHGASFRAETWKDIGTLPFILQRGYRVVALDLPGCAESENVSIAPEEFLFKFFNHLEITQPVIVSPSMSGKYSLPFAITYPENIGGLVAVAPIGIPHYLEKLRGRPLPILAIWGSNDTIVPLEHLEMLLEAMPKIKRALLKNAGHASYMRATAQFNYYLVKFLELLNRDRAKRLPSE